MSLDNDFELHLRLRDLAVRSATIAVMSTPQFDQLVASHRNALGVPEPEPLEAAAALANEIDLLRAIRMRIPASACREHHVSAFTLDSRRCLDELAALHHIAPAAYLTLGANPDRWWWHPAAARANQLLDTWRRA